MIQTRAKYIVTDNANAARALEAVKDLDAVKEIFVIGEHVGCTSVSQLMQEEDLSDSTAMHLSGSSQIFDTESLAWLTYSSGTTALLKRLLVLEDSSTLETKSIPLTPKPVIKNGDLNPRTSFLR